MHELAAAAPVAVMGDEQRCRLRCYCVPVDIVSKACAMPTVSKLTQRNKSQMWSSKIPTATVRPPSPFRIEQEICPFLQETGYARIM